MGDRIMSDIDKIWLESATLKEMEDEYDILCEEVLNISHQIDMANEFGCTRPKGWKQKAKRARSGMNLQKEIIKRSIGDARSKQKQSLSKARDNLLIKLLRDDVGEDRFFEIVATVESAPEIRQEPPK